MVLYQCVCAVCVYTTAAGQVTSSSSTFSWHPQLVISNTLFILLVCLRSNSRMSEWWWSTTVGLCVIQCILVCIQTAFYTGSWNASGSCTLHANIRPCECERIIWLLNEASCDKCWLFTKQRPYSCVSGKVLTFR